MAKIPLTQENLNSLYRAFAFYFPEGTVRDAEFSAGDLKWESLNNFIQDVSDTSDLEVDARDLKTVKAAQIAIEKKFTAEEKAAKEKAEANIPQNREQLEAERAKREAAIKETEEKAKEETAAEIAKREEYAKQRKIIQDQIAKSQAAQTELQDKKAYVKVETPQAPTLSPDEQTAYTKLKDLAQKNPVQLKEEISEAIKGKIPDVIKQNSAPEELDLYADSVATSAVINLRSAAPPPPDVETAVLATAATDESLLPNYSFQPDAQKVLAQGLNDIAQMRMTVYQAPANALDLVVGPNVRQLIVGPSPAEIKASFQSTPQGATHELDFGKLNSNYQSALQNPVFSFAQGEIKGKLIDFGKQQLVSKLSSLPPESFLGKIAATQEFQGALTMLKPYASFEFVGAEGLPGVFGRLVAQFSPESAPLVSGVGQMFGIDFGFAPITSAVTPVAADVLTTGAGGVATEAAVTTISAVGAEAVTTGVGVAAGEAAGVTAGAAAGATAGAAAGGPAAPVTAIIGAVIGFVISLIPTALHWLSDKYQKNKEMVVAIPAAILVTLFAGPLAGAAAGLGTYGLMSFAGGGSVASGISSAVSGILTATGAIMATFLAAIGTPILAFMIGFPVIVALILFIINSGAYVVPPGMQSLLSTNPYIDVTKEVTKIVDKSGNDVTDASIKNSQLPLTVSYTVTVTAKKSVLSAVKFSNTCQIITSGAGGTCPAETPTAPSSISPGSSFTFSSDEKYSGGSYNNSTVLDTFKVTANSVEQNNVETSASATVSIGTPPTACLSIDKTKWPPAYYANIVAARATLVSKFSNYISKVCLSYKDLPLKYNPAGHGPYWGWNHGTYIDFFAVGVKNQPDALYTLAHELGHSLIWGSKTAHIHDSYLRYLGISSEAPYCFYADTKNFNKDESLPEAIALYVIQPRCGSVQQKWPIHYRFLKKFIFN